MIAQHPGECKPHPYQDKAYGKGFRVMNPVLGDKKDVTGGRCTVCCPPKEKGKKRGGVYSVNELKFLRR